MVHVMGIAQGKHLSWGLLGGRKTFIVNCASTRTIGFMGESEIAESYSLQMADLSVLCLQESEAGKVRVAAGSRCGGVGIHLE
jgi:hypothetical protein